MTLTIWHNPRCSKSRETLKLLEAREVAVDVRHYLQSPPDADEIRAALKTLGLSARDLMRKGEQVYKDLGLAQVEDDGVLITAMATHPILIERPVVINGKRAAIGRPPEAVLDIL